MTEAEHRHTQTHDELNRVFDDGSVFDEIKPENLKRYLQALATINLQSDPVRTNAIVRALKINHLQMESVISTFEKTIRDLNAQNSRNEKWVALLAIASLLATVVGILNDIYGSF